MLSGYGSGCADLLEEHSSCATPWRPPPTLAYRLLLALSRCSAMLPDLEELTEEDGNDVAGRAGKG